MVGVWGVMTGQGGNDAAQISLPGGNSAPTAWVAVVAVGFVLWFAGRVMVSLSRAPRKKPRQSDDSFAWPDQIDDEVAKPEHSDAEAAKPDRHDDDGETVNPRSG